MKHILFLLVFLLLPAWNSMSAQSSSGNPLPWHMTKPHPGGPRQKSPALRPSVSIEGYTLYIDDAMESTFLLIPEGEEDPVCTLYAPDGTAEVQIPNDLEGTFTILLIRGSLTFEAVIELEAEP